MSRRHVSFWPTCIQGALVITITSFGSHWLNAHTIFGIVPSVGIALAVGMVTGFAALGVANGIFHTYTVDGKRQITLANLYRHYCGRSPGHRCGRFYHAIIAQAEFYSKTRTWHKGPERNAMNDNRPPTTHAKIRMQANEEELTVICSDDADPLLVESAAKLIRDHPSLAYVELQDLNRRSIFAYRGEDPCEGKSLI